MPRAGKDGRILSKQISLSETMAALGDPTTVLVATWLLPHCDDQGRLQCNPRRLKAQAFPLLDSITASDIEQAIARMAEAGLVVLYSAPDGTPLLQYRQWWRFQDGQDWVYPSEWPAPKGWADRLYYRRKGQIVEQAHSYNPAGDCTTMCHNVEHCAQELQELHTHSTTTATTTATSSCSGEGVQGEGGEADPPAPESTPPTDPELRVRGVAQAFASAGGIVSSLVHEKMAESVQEHPAVDSFVAARAVQGYGINLPPGQRITVGDVEGILVLLELYSEAEWAAALAYAVKAKKVNLRYIGAVLSGRKADESKPPARASPDDSPWGVVGLTREEFLEKHGEWARQEVERWDKERARWTPTTASNGPD